MPSVFPFSASRLKSSISTLFFNKIFPPKIDIEYFNLNLHFLWENLCHPIKPQTRRNFFSASFDLHIFRMFYSYNGDWWRILMTSLQKEFCSYFWQFYWSQIYRTPKNILHFYTQSTGFTESGEWKNFISVFIHFRSLYLFRPFCRLMVFL